MNCPGCRFVLPDDKAAECPFCHASLRSGPAAPPPASPPAAEPPASLPPMPTFDRPAKAAATPPPLPFRQFASPPTPPARPAEPSPFTTAPVPKPGPPIGGPPVPPPPVGGIPGLPLPTPQLGANPDPLNLEGLHRPQPETRLPLSDPLADPLAFKPPPPLEAPAPPPGAPEEAASSGKPGEIDWEAPPPSNRNPAKNFLIFGVLAAIGIGWQSGYLSLDFVYNMLSRGIPPPPMEPLPPIGRLPSVSAAEESAVPASPPAANAPPAGPAPSDAAKPAPPPVQAAGPEPEKPRPQWVFEGRIYDMITLRPVFAAELRLEAGDEKPAAAQTDENGRYRVSVPALEGETYQLTLTHPDYDGKRYFDEISPPYRTLDAQERRAMRRLVPRHKAWAGRVGGKTRRDLVLVPGAGRIESSDETDSPPEGQ